MDIHSFIEVYTKGRVKIPTWQKPLIDEMIRRKKLKVKVSKRCKS